MKLGLWLISTGLLVFGLALPVIRISISASISISDALASQPALGFWLQENGLSFETLEPMLASFLGGGEGVEFSILSSVKELFVNGSYFAALVIALFSIIFPILKQLVLLLYILKPDQLAPPVLSFFDQVHKWAMLDVFVLALAVLATTTSSLWQGELLIGAGVFLIYILVTFGLFQMVRPKAASQVKT